MNKYLRKWVDETYPLMGNDIEELDQYDINKFANWLEKQLSISRVSKSLPSNDLANWTLRTGWVYNFCDEKWWQLQESHNYIKKTTKEIADMIEGNVC